MKRFTLAALAALAASAALALPGTAAPATKASETLLRAQAARLTTTLGYANRFIVRDREVIRTGYAYEPIGPYVEAVIQHPDIGAYWHHLNLMKHIVARDTAKLALVQKKIEAVHATSCGASAAACAWYYDGATQCEVDHEGAFTTNTGNGYYGRFQMDLSFQSSTDYGRWALRTYGTADRWPPGVQIQHAYNVWLSRGWNPWPPYYKYGCARYHGGSYQA